MNTTCPHCGEQAMSALRKSFLGPARSVACQSCGKRISVAWSGMLFMLPALLGIVLINVAPGVVPLLLVVFGTILYVVAHMWWVPLVSKE